MSEPKVEAVAREIAELPVASKLRVAATLYEQGKYGSAKVIVTFALRQMQMLQGAQ